MEPSPIQLSIEHKDPSHDTLVVSSNLEEIAERAVFGQKNEYGITRVRVDKSLKANTAFTELWNPPRSN